MNTSQLHRSIGACFSLMLGIAAPVAHATQCQSMLVDFSTAYIECNERGGPNGPPTVLTQESGFWKRLDVPGSAFGNNGGFSSEWDWDSTVPGTQFLPAWDTLSFMGPSWSNLSLPLVLGTGNANQMRGKVEFVNGFIVESLTIDSSLAPNQKNSFDTYQLTSNQVTANNGMFTIDFPTGIVQELSLTLGNNTSNVLVQSLSSFLNVSAGEGDTQIFAGEGTTQTITGAINVVKRGKGHIYLDVDDSKDTIGRSISYYPTAIEGLLPRAITWNSIDSISLLLGKGNDFIRMVSTANVAISPFRDSLIDLGEGNNECFISGDALSGFSTNNIAGRGGNDLFTVSAIPASKNAFLYINGSNGGDRVKYLGAPFQLTSFNATQGRLNPTNPLEAGFMYDSIENF